MFSWMRGLMGGAPADNSEQVAAIQAAAVKACGFLPMAESVASMVAAGNPAVISVTVIATQICKIVTKTKPLPAMQLISQGSGPRLQQWDAGNGLILKGAFVKK
jgi:hypothetical protein